MLARDRMIASMSQASPHMCTGMTACVRGPTAASTAFGIDSNGVVDVDDDGDRAGGEHGDGGGHVGAGGHEHLVAGADAEADERGGQGRGAAGRREAARA